MKTTTQKDKKVKQAAPAPQPEQQQPAKLKKSVALKDPRASREARGETQAPYWNLFGTTQSGGSRYENDRPIPNPTAMLMVLHEQGKVSDDDLKEALAIVKLTFKRR